MPGKPGTIICDAARAPASSAGFLAGDLHDTSGHHRYYGSSAVDGGAPIVETRAGRRLRPARPFGI